MTIEVQTDQKIKNIITSYFQIVDEEVSDYIHNVLYEGRQCDFTNPNDIYECLGELFHDVVPNATEESTYKLCEKIFDSIVDHKSIQDSQSKLSKLDAPVHLGKIFSLQENMYNDYKSIWLAQKEVKSTVCKKKLVKAEAKLKQKQDKRDQDKGTPVLASWQKEATTSQMISKTGMKADETGKSKDIKIENFDISFGDRKLLTNAELSLNFGRRYGLVGRNGIGKSTLLKMIANGSLVIPKHISILFVEQEVIGDETTALEAVLESDEVRTRLLKEEKELLSVGNNDEDASTKLQEIYNQLQAIEAEKAPSRASKILVGLGFTPEMQERPTRTFSGGWRMRISLARALFSKPDLLLLDEPSNMLDSKSIIWLQKYLVNSWSSILLVVSHDQAFLNEISTDILHFHSQRIDAYRGDYDYYEKTKVEKRKNQEKEYEAQVAFRKHVQEFIDKFRFNAKRASLVQSKIKMLDKLPPLVPVEKEQPVVLRFPEPEPLSGAPILQLDEVTFRYGPDQPTILENIDISCNLDTRLVIVGDNGSGKTTLLKLLNGFLEPTKGLRNVHRNLRIGYFSQHHIDQLNLNQNSIQFMAEKFPGMVSEQYRAFLGKFMISGDLATQPIAALSGGQKSRVAFAMVAMLNPNVLILDEPTNHLDIETVRALAESINRFKGGAILVSHDQQLIKLCCKELWLVKDKGVKSIKGGYDEYRRIIETELKDVL